MTCLFKNILLVNTTALLLSVSCQKKQRFIFFGDSITELGLKRNGFITIIDSISKAQGNAKYEFIGAGVSGDKVTDLYYRLDKDVINKDPQIVIIFIGINDVWHKRLLGTGTDPEKFQKFYQAIIDRLKERSIKVILCTPTVIGEHHDNSNELDGDLDRYSNIIRSLAENNKLPLIDLRNKFLAYLKENNSENKEKDILTYDKVHLNSNGNLLVANVIWEALKNYPRR